MASTSPRGWKASPRRAGAICLSQDACRQVKGRLDLAVTDLGPTQLKNIADPIRVYSLEVGRPAEAKPASPTTPTHQSKRLASKSAFAAVAAAIVGLLAAAGGWYMLGGGFMKPLQAPRLSVVVLPFENLSGDKEQDYFADGITDDLTTDLSHLPDSFVISRGTAFTYKGKSVDAKQMSRELGVRYLLEGSVRRVGETITINAQLISTETGAQVWADHFDGERNKLGELQVQIVARLSNSLGVQLVKAEALRAARERPNNPDAADLAMQGWAAYNNGFSRANVDAAMSYFERALQLDPGLPRAQVGLAWGLVDRAFRRATRRSVAPRSRKRSPISARRSIWRTWRQ